ncbi:MAG: hypothetical protein JWO15_589 [Sphingomonadales bacterium]|nr:hypothetical protein [Sphingomonadales bacterium]
MTKIDLGTILEDIGKLLAHDLGVDPEGAFLYAKAGRAWAGGGIYKDLGNQILYRGPSEALFERIMDAWDATEHDKKWEVMQYTIINGSFQAQFEYLDDLNPEEASHWRCQRILKERYGDKPIDYSDPEPR